MISETKSYSAVSTVVPVVVKTVTTASVVVKTVTTASVVVKTVTTACHEK